MKRRIQFGKTLLAAASIALLALPCAAQKHENKPPQRQAPRQQAPRQERRQQQQENRKAQNNRPNNDRPRNNAAPNREPQNRQPESMSMIGGNRPPNARNDSERPNINPNRPPNATVRRSDLTPQQRQNLDKFDRLPPQEKQKIRDRERVWQQLTPQQQNHIKNDVFPVYNRLPPARQRAIKSRLDVLQNMPESARNQHLNDPNFTRGMSEEDKAMLRDLGHMHVGAPDPPNE